MAREIDDGVRAAEIFVANSEDAHFLERGVRGEPETMLDPRGLERKKFEAAAGEDGLPGPSGGGAKAALAVVENPAASPGGSLAAAGPVRVICFRHFCRFRIIRAKIFHFVFTPRSLSALSLNRANFTSAGVGRRSIWT